MVKTAMCAQAHILILSSWDFYMGIRKNCGEPITRARLSVDFLDICELFILRGEDHLRMCRSNLKLDDIVERTKMILKNSHYFIIIV